MTAYELRLLQTDYSHTQWHQVTDTCRLLLSIKYIKSYIVFILILIVIVYYVVLITKVLFVEATNDTVEFMESNILAT